MQTIKPRSGNLNDSRFLRLGITCLLLTQALLATPAFAHKTKADHTRPQSKTQPKILASRLNARTPEPERKGKQGAATQPVPAPLGKKLLKPETIAAAHTPRAQGAKLKAQPRTQRASEKPVLAKALTKTAGKTLATSKAANKATGKAANKAAGKATKATRLSEQPLTSRLTRASFTPLTPAKPQAESERRGKFGKLETGATRSDNRRTEREEEKAVAALPPLRRNETANVREPERNPARGSERVEAIPATRPREINAPSDTPGYQIQLPDKIEVIEYGSTSPTVAKLLTLPEARPLTPFGAIVTKNSTPPAKRNDLAIPQERVLEIQYELVKRGFYNTEPNGLYDEATILAMWEFQKNYGLPATGYPSAHALKRLGLTSW